MDHNRLIGELFQGPLDIVGDIHGEIDALEALLEALGYAADGAHRDGRRLVFVGDLVDRGPDSPAVLRRVRDLVVAGHAQCVLGNHELNLLRDDAKPENAWWMDPDGPAAVTDPGTAAGVRRRPSPHPAAHVSAADKPQLREFLESLPILLERDDLRVVHACWHGPSVERIRALSAPVPGAAGLYEHFIRECTRTMLENRFLSFVKREWNLYAPRLHDPEWEAVLMPAKAELDARIQMENPVAVLTSGMERAARQPFWAGGKWRMVNRVKWWEEYTDPVPVIFGHYWRRFGTMRAALNDKHGPDLFAGIEPHHWMGARRNVYCVDFSVGARAGERAAQRPVQHCKLAAVRVPEWEVVHDDGERCALQ